MTWAQLFTSTIGKKIVMALTGIFLITFLVIHVGLNACIWANDHGVMFNKAAHFMGSTEVPRILEIGLFIGFLIHIIQGLVIEAKNRSKRTVGYAVSYGNKGSKWYSRSMGLLGTIVLLFLVIHWINFWVPSRFTGVEEVELPDKSTVHDLYGLMYTTFESMLIVIIYTVGCISLAYHLAHGFQSAFKTLGVSNKRYFKILRGIGNAFAIIVPLMFIIMPISMHFHWINEPMTHVPNPTVPQ